MRFKSDSDKWLVINTLRAAAVTYRDDAALFHRDCDKPLKRQLEVQAAHAERIANEVEQEG